MGSFFTSDYHFDHTNILKHANRPFSIVEEMNNTIISNHNSKVSKVDKVYFLGDFAFGHRHEYFLKQLNGQFILILGNHDRLSANHYLNMGFTEVHDYLELNINKNKWVLCHYPMRAWNKSFHGSYHLFGHVHNCLPSHGLSFDVGVDCHNFFPLSQFEVESKMLELAAAGAGNINHPPERI